ncbi:MAG: serine/threonine-protein kinase [Verrucomicrobia bacterium]|nr:serine/threonine-protein kinase [Verrucomicrobiota bacterium]
MSNQDLISPSNNDIPSFNDGTASQSQGGSILLNEFEIERELGRGGMGKVYLVRSRTTGRKFALKEALVKDNAQQKAFLAELQTWIDLPEHPNILACRFFRTVGNETLIFADYCESGSLADWIANGNLHTLEQKLDVAIQFAWGIHAIHERGLVHQDIKPGNVLMTKNGVPKVADFGLARARQRMAATSELKGAQSVAGDPVLVTSAGMTPAYASPEQRAGRALSSKTDMWSWAVSVMDMFLGEVSCPYGGHIAAETLDATVSAVCDIAEQHIPEDVVEVLRRCFQFEPAQRWTSLAAVVEALVSIYEASTGTLYNKILRTPETRDEGHLELPSHERYTLTPDQWLSHAERLAGNVIKRRGQDAFTAKGSLVRSIQIMDEVVPVIERHMDDAQRESLQRFLDAVYVSADLNCRLSDENGCLTKLRSALETLQGRDTAKPSVRIVLGNAFHSYAVALRKFKHTEESLVAAGEALGLFESVPLEPGLAFDTARCLQTLCTILSDQGKDAEALKVFEKVFALLDHPECQGSILTLALALNNGGICAKKCGHHELAVAGFENCVHLREQLLTNNPEDWDSRDLLAGTLGNLAAALVDLGRKDEALEAIGEAIRHRSELLRMNSEPELRVTLAKSHFNRASVLFQMERWSEAVRAYAQVLEIVSPLLELEGRSDLKSLIEAANSNQDSALQGIEERSLEDADNLFGDLVIAERLAITQCHSQLRATVLGRLLSNWAGVKRRLNQSGTAWLILEEAIGILENTEESNHLLETSSALMLSYRNLSALLIDLHAFSKAENVCAKSREYYVELGAVEKRGTMTESFCNIGLCMAHAQAAQGKTAMALALLNELSDLVTSLDNSNLWRPSMTEMIRDLRGKILAEGVRPENPSRNQDQGQLIAFDAYSRRQEGDFTNAIRLYEKAVELNPSDESLWINLSVAYVKLKSYQTAIQCCDRAVALCPDNGSVWLNRGLMLFEQHSFADAAASFDRAYELGVADAEAKARYCRDIVEGRI